MAILGATGASTGLALIVAGADYLQYRTRELDPLTATVTSSPAYGRNNWIEIGVGIPLFVFSWSLGMTKVGEL